MPWCTDRVAEVFQPSLQEVCRLHMSRCAGINPSFAPFASVQTAACRLQPRKVHSQRDAASPQHYSASVQYDVAARPSRLCCRCPQQAGGRTAQGPSKQTMCSVHACRPSDSTRLPNSYFSTLAALLARLRARACSCLLLAAMERSSWAGWGWLAFNAALAACALSTLLSAVSRAALLAASDV